MIRGAIYFDSSSPKDAGVKYEIIDGTNIPNDNSIPVGDDSSSYTPAQTDTVILSSRDNIKCWPVWDTNAWKFYVSDDSYVGYVYYTIHE